MNITTLNNDLLRILEEVISPNSTKNSFFQLSKVLSQFNDINQIKLENLGIKTRNLKKGSDSDLVFQQDNLLLWAIYQNNIPLITFLLNSGINVNISGYSALQHLVRTGNLKLLKFLLNYNKKENYLKLKHLWKNKNLSIKNKIINFYKIVNSKKLIQINTTGLEALAAEYGHISILNYFKEINALDDHNNLFYAAATNGNEEVVKYMIDSNIKPDDFFANLSLILLIKNHMFDQVLKFLKVKIIPNEVMRELIEINDIKKIKNLYSSGYQVYVKGKEFYGKSVLTFAAHKGKIDIVEFFLKNGMGLEIINDGINYPEEIKSLFYSYKVKIDLMEKLEKNLYIKTTKEKVNKI